MKCVGIIIIAITLTCLMIGRAQARSAALYRAYFPSTDSCDKQASLLIASFKRQTGADIISTKCFDAAAGSPADLMITYLPVTETDLNDLIIGGTPIGGDSIALSSDAGASYPSQTACESDIKNQTSIFASVEGTPALTGYCTPLIEGGSDYILHLNTFLPVKKLLFVLRAFDAKASAANSLIIQQKLARSGATLARVDGGNFFFYDSSIQLRPAHVHLSSTAALVSGVDSACLTERFELSALMAAHGSDALVACVATDVGGAYPGFSGMVVDAVGSDLDVWSFQTANSLGYQTFAECNFDKQRIISQARGTDSAIVGGVCGFTGDGADGDYNVTFVRFH